MSRYLPKIVFLVLGSLVIFKTSLPLIAREFEMKEGVLTGSFDTTVSIGTAWRIQERDNDLIGDDNGDYLGSSRYLIEHPEDIHLLGISFNTLLGRSGIALQGEFSYRNNMPLQIDDNELIAALLTPTNSSSTQLGRYNYGKEIQGFKHQKVGQWQATASRAFGPNNPFKATNVFLMGELGFTRVFDMEDKHTLKYDAPLTATADAFSYGYRLVMQTDYANAIGAIKLSPGIAFSHDVQGISPGPGGNFIQGQKALNLKLGASYLERWYAELSYTRYYGMEHINLIHDRDFMAINFKYYY